MEKKNQNQKNNEKHVPIRTCIGTGEKRSKKELIRIVNIKDGDSFKVQIDLRDKLDGRGANLIPDVLALEKALKNRGFERAFKRKLRDEEVEYLKSEFPKAIEEKLFRPNNKPVTIKIKQ